MRNPATILLLSFALGGCGWLPLQSSTQPEAPPLEEWLVNPVAFSTIVAVAGSEEKRRLREDALQTYLSAPQLRSQAYLALVLDACVSSEEEAREAGDALDAVIADPPSMTPASRAFLTALSLAMTRKAETLRELEQVRSDYLDLRNEHRDLRQSKNRADAALKARDAALAEANDKLRALKSIETSLQTEGVPR